MSVLYTWIIILFIRDKNLELSKFVHIVWKLNYFLVLCLIYFSSIFFQFHDHQRTDDFGWLQFAKTPSISFPYCFITLKTFTDSSNIFPSCHVCPFSIHLDLVIKIIHNLRTFPCSSSRISWHKFVQTTFILSYDQYVMMRAVWCTVPSCISSLPHQMIIYADICIII